MTPASTKIWMPLYVADYLADTGRLTTEQHGAYLLMLMDYWRSGPLPDDNDALAQITRLTPERWKKHRMTLSRFFQIEDGEWRHRRVDAELAKAAENKAMRQERAKKAAAARWDNEPGEDAPSNASSNAPSNQQAMLESCPSSSSSSSTPKPQPKSRSKPPKNHPLALARFDDFWKVWPKKEKKQDAKKAWSKHKLDSIADQVIADVEASAKTPGKWRGGQMKFCPLPPSYLSGKRWEDEWQQGADSGRLEREDPDEAERINTAAAKRAEDW